MVADVVRAAEAQLCDGNLADKLAPCLERLSSSERGELFVKKKHVTGIATRLEEVRLSARSSRFFHHASRNAAQATAATALPALQQLARLVPTKDDVPEKECAF